VIAINGLGRIGRLTVRWIALTHPHQLCALNDPADLETVVHLLRFDSVHGGDHPPVAGIRRDGKDFIRMQGHEYPLFHETDPERIPFPQCGARLVVEASGRFTERAAAARHLKGSVAHVIISAPSPDADITVIHPFNGHLLDPARHHVISNASCTAHATAPMLDVLERGFGFRAAGMSTVHVVTNDQRILDMPHKDLRRARSAFMSIIPTTSSAFGALHKALPELPFDDVAVAVAYYRDVLGFHINYQQDDLGVMDRDEITVLLIARTKRHSGVGSAYIYVEDADALHAELCSKGANVQGEPISHPWGLRDFRLIDNEGNWMAFGQPFE